MHENKIINLQQNLKHITRFEITAKTLTAVNNALGSVLFYFSLFK